MSVSGSRRRGNAELALLALNIQVFEQSFLDDVAGPSRSWTLVASVVGQSALLALVAVLPLIFTYKLPLEEWGLHTVLIAPPAPPQPAPPPAARVEQVAKPERYDEILMQPRSIPDQVTIIDKTPIVVTSVPAPGGVVGAVTGVSQPMLNGFIPMPPPVKPIRVGGRIQAARLVERLPPTYPEQAREENITGVVILEAIIDKAGQVRNIKLVGGHPMLAPSAIEAVSQWRYQPTLLNGQAVEVISRVEVTYTLSAPIDPRELRKQQRRERREAKP